MAKKKPAAIETAEASAPAIGASTLRDEVLDVCKLLGELPPLRRPHNFAPCWRGVTDSFPELVAQHVRLTGEIGVDLAYDYSATILFAALQAKAWGLKTLGVSVTADPYAKFCASLDPRDAATDSRFKDDRDWMADRIAKLQTACQAAAKKTGVEVSAGVVLLEQEIWKRNGRTAWIGGKKLDLTSEGDVQAWDASVSTLLTAAEKLFLDSLRCEVDWAELGAMSINGAGAASLNSCYPPTFAANRPRSISIYEGNDVDRARLRYAISSASIPAGAWGAVNPILGAGVSGDWSCDKRTATVPMVVLDTSAPWRLGYDLNQLGRWGRSPNPLVCDWTLATRVHVWPGIGRSDKWGDLWLAWYVAYLAGAAANRDPRFHKVGAIGIGFKLT